jgi:3-oxoacid CoA-transferase
MLARSSLSRLSFASAVAHRAFSASARRNASKVYPSAEAAVEAVKSGDIVLSGGFGLCGVPSTLINALSKRTDVKNLTGVSNNAGALVRGEMKGLGKLLETKQISKMIASFLGT